MSVWLAHLTLKYCEEQPTNANCKTAAEAKVENELQHAATSRIRWQMMPAQKTNPLPNHLDAFLVWRPLVLRVPVSPSRGCRAALVKADEDRDSAAVDAGLPILMDLKWCRSNPKPIEWKFGFKVAYTILYTYLWNQFQYLCWISYPISTDHQPWICLTPLEQSSKAPHFWAARNGGISPKLWPQIWCSFVPVNHQTYHLVI